MIVEQIYCYNSLRNFNYIIACEQTLEAVVIDPLRTDLILDLAESKQYKIKYIINTHEHADHTQGNKELVEKTAAAVYCHYNAVDKIPMANHGLNKGDVIIIGDTIRLEALDTPGHTMAHVCLLAQDKSTQALFSGDTLFNAGTGHCYHGDVDQLYDSFTNILDKLSDQTIVYPGHDYMENNIGFTLSREPDNNNAKELLAKFKAINNNDQSFIITTMGIERQINAFFRLDNKTIIDNLNLKNSNNLDKKIVFVALRALRDEW